MGKLCKKPEKWQNCQRCRYSIRRYLLATSDFSKSIQDDVNYYVTRDKINNASFRQKLDPIAKNILRTQNPLELVFQDISTFDAGNVIVGSLLRELDVAKKDTESDLIKKALQPPGLDFLIQNRLDKLRNTRNNDNNSNSNNNNNNNYLSLLPSPPPSFFQPPQPQFLPPQPQFLPPQPPLQPPQPPLPPP